MLGFSLEWQISLTFNAVICDLFLIFPVCLTLMFVLSTSQACSMVDMLITKLALHQLPCHQVQMMRKRMRRMRKQVGFSFTPVSCSLPTQFCSIFPSPETFFLEDKMSL